MSETEERLTKLEQRLESLEKDALTEAKINENVALAAKRIVWVFVLAIVAGIGGYISTIWNHNG